ncbi:hypothetical protein [Mucilaginibacter kameinonensis]|uniref:hypothetical protein n=1 Tax=Mucilaginibacter kameinonensis TaxID=452286 RepID=UPI000EF7D794|nr:hypothetical protein [Mucilaginibacter kameinonensis]
MIEYQEQTEKQSITEMVLKIFVAHFLRRNLTAYEMINVFKLVEQNPDGKTRLDSLLNGKYTTDLTKGQIEQAIEYLSDFAESNHIYIKKNFLLQLLSNFYQKQREKNQLNERVTALAEAGYLNPTLTAGEMICVFDLIEHNQDGKDRIRRLIEEDCTTGKLSELQIQQAIELLNDYSKNNI